MVNDLASAVVGADLTKFIHVIRGRHVVVDCDLAALHGVETKVFNQAAKRNIARFRIKIGNNRIKYA
ncbi:ORF6N domain-containing protein [Adlercreutzia caecimuris]|uniref:ORF6N domain-containing protein n=1 Tax=Adlercreutzia caecimuris TaxID=671266 RepID=A0A4S4G7Y6_9ACTN|nr:ORF6N domain-containing protein [Adlercreutzia caecimuris]THG38998.1 ORF6N domain-containing protein [Adlercreutzia caecimuris]